MRNILIIDNHPIVIEGFKNLLKDEKDLNIIGSVRSAFLALEFVKSKETDLIIMDLSLKDRSGIELIKDLQISHPHIKILVVSLYDEEIYAERILRAGARGYIMKSEKVEKILNAIRKIASGEVYLSKRMQNKVIERVASRKRTLSYNILEILTDRELEVFELIGEGLKTTQIADRMKLSIKTIETYKSHLKSKLDLKNSVELIQRAVTWKFERKTIV